jgi:hypothetical protein
MQVTGKGSSVQFALAVVRLESTQLILHKLARTARQTRYTASTLLGMCDALQRAPQRHKAGGHRKTYRMLSIVWAPLGGAGLAGFEQQNGNLTQVEINEVLLLVCHV